MIENITEFTHLAAVCTLDISCIQAINVKENISSCVTNCKKRATVNLISIAITPIQLWGEVGHLCPQTGNHANLSLSLKRTR